MKYTKWQKIKSTFYNLAKTKASDLSFFIPYKEKVDKYLGDLTKEEDYDERDYTLDGSESLPVLRREIKYMIDQSLEWRTRNSCVPASLLLSLYHNANIKPSKEEFKAFLDYLENVGHWKESSGASAPIVVKSIVTQWNKLYPNNKMEYRRVGYGTAGYKELFEKGYAMAGGYNTFPEYAEDLAEDGKVNKTKYSDSKRRGGHYVGIMYGSILKKLGMVEITNSGEIKRGYDISYDLETVVNQYPTRHKELNVHAHEAMSSHTSNAYWYSWFYAIIPQNIIEQENIPTIGEGKKSYEDLERENAILRRRADESEQLQKKSLKALKPNEYK